MLVEGTDLDHYHLEKLIDWGAFGEVFQAFDTKLSRYVAIKVLTPRPAHEHKEAMRLFKREMAAVTLLDHPHILLLYDFGEATVNNRQYAYLVMPYRQDGNLGVWLNEKKLHDPFPSLPEVAHILTQAAKALQEAHNNKILHLDVKPSNFLIRKDKGNPNYPYLQLADFGIAKFVNTSAEFTRVRRGTIYYMPPEQWEGDPNPASDQYALAVMIYLILTYKMPFEGDNELTIQNLHFNKMPDAPSLINTHIPPEIDAVILKALAKNYEDRHSSVTAFASAFTDALTTESEIERKLTNQLRSLFEDVHELRTNPPVNQTLTQQIEKVSKQASVMQSPAASNQQELAHLQQLVVVLQNNQAGYHKILQQFQQLSQKPGKIISTPTQIGFAIIISLLILILIAASSFSLIFSLQTHTTLLNIQATANAANANATAAATIIATYRYPSYLPGHGTIALHDSLNATNNYYNWDTTSSGCSFTNGTYDVIEPSSAPPYLQTCLDTATGFNNFAIEVTMTINSGNCGGIVFGSNRSRTDYYTYQICANGNHYFPVVNGNHLIDWYNGPDSNIHDTKHTNTLAIFVNGNNIAFYVNHQPISLSDDSFIKNSQGYIGVLAADYDQPTGEVTDVSYTNVKVWTLP